MIKLQFCGLVWSWQSPTETTVNLLHIMLLNLHLLIPILHLTLQASTKLSSLVAAGVALVIAVVLYV